MSDGGDAFEAARIVNLHLGQRPKYRVFRRDRGITNS
jgi:hypothetical protein